MKYAEIKTRNASETQLNQFVLIEKKLFGA